MMGLPHGQIRTGHLPCAAKNLTVNLNIFATVVFKIQNVQELVARV